MIRGEPVEIEKLEQIKRDTELVHQEGNKEMVENITTENNGSVAEILLPERNETNKHKKDEKVDLERQKIINDKSKKDKTCKETTHLVIEFDNSENENMRSESDKSSEEAPIKNLEKDDNQKEELVIGNEESGKEDQNKDSPGTNNQIFHPEKDIREGYDKDQGGELDIKKTNESFHNHDPIQDKQKVNDREGLEDLRREYDIGKLAPCADAYLRKGMAKEGNMTWCEENGWKKRIFLNYAERGKQLRNSRNLRPQTTSSISSVMTSNHTVLTDTTICNYVLFIALLFHFYFIIIPIWYLIMISE